MSLLRIIFAIVVGLLGYGLMQWLTKAPQGLDVLVGLAVGIVGYVSYPSIKLT
jgi:hypothetical protein